MAEIGTGFTVRRSVCGMAFAILLAAGVARASVTGSISGTVTDPTGAVVPGVQVVALNTQTGVEQTTQTNAQGFYSLPALPVGRYEMRIQVAGFKEYRQTGLVLDVNTALRVDTTLQVGAVTQEVNVSAAAVHVDTSSTQMGEVIGTSKVELVPLNGRSYTDLLALQPGVVPVSSGEYSGTQVSGSLNPGNLSVSGQREDANGFMVNGGNVQEDVQMGTAIIPNLDSIAEFRILTNNADAEYGNFSGGLVNVITKSGTNQFHGDVFEFLRNSDLDARNFYSTSRGTLHQNQFGGTAGGPIRHDKVFFFSDYQGSRVINGVDSGLITVPTAADRTGNLGAAAFGSISSGVFTPNTVTGAGWANTLSKELGYSVQAGEPYSLYNASTQTNACTSTAFSSSILTPSSCVFPNGVIPSGAFSAPAGPLMQYIPAPNLGTNTFTTSAFDNTLRDDKGSGRIDANTRFGLLSGYYFFDQYSVVNPYPSANVPGFSAANQGRAQDINFAVTKNFGPSSVNEFRLNYVRNVNSASVPIGGLGPSLSSLGFVTGTSTLGIVPLAPQYIGVPSIGFNNFTIGTPGYISTQTNNTYQGLDNFSTVRGTHTLKFGGAIHYDLVTYHQEGANNGTFGFNGQETGSDFADFLLGAPDFYQQGAQIPFHTRSRYYGLYAQDSWRATPKLTLNYGLRYEISTPWYEAFGEMEALVLGQQSVVFPGSPKGWVFPGDPGIPKTIAPTRYNNFAPRIGLAYSPDASGGFLGKLVGGPGRTSIRASFGVYYTAFEDAAFFNAQGDAPFGFFYSSPTPPLFATPFVDRQTGNSEGQRFPPPLPPTNVSAKNPDPVSFANFLPIGSSPVIATSNRVPYAEHYNFSIQRQFGTNTLASVSYVGTQGHRLLGDVEANPGVPSLCLSVSQLSQVMPGTPTCGPNAENGVYYPIGGGVINSTRAPFGPAFSSDAYFATMANSNYSALEATLRRTVGRLEFLAGYTYGKALDNASGWGAGGDLINPINPKISKSLSAFDITHNFVMSYSYRVPFDKLWRANRLTDGWIVTGITRFTTGLPVFLQETDDRSLLGTGGSGPCGCQVDVPNVTPGSLQITDPRKGNPSAGTNPYFNNSLFSREANNLPGQFGQLGNANRRYFHGPGYNNWDLALLKDLRLTESKKLEFRAEFFNIFNHAQFGAAGGGGGPQGSILNSNFGFVTSADAPRIGQVAVKFYF